jgi:hypothetical protein
MLFKNSHVLPKIKRRDAAEAVKGDANVATLGARANRRERATEGQKQ